LLRGRIEPGRGAAAMRLGLDRTGGATSLQQPDEEGQADGEQVGDLTQRILTAINDAHDAFTQIIGVGTHEDTSSGDVPSLGYWFPYATRVRPALASADAPLCASRSNG